MRPGVLEAVPADQPVLLVGTGLTAVDVALTLTADGRRTAPVVAVSRCGLLPLTHTADAAPPTVPSLDECATLRDVVRAVRAAAGEAGDWRPVVDGLRPLLDQLWGALTPGEQDAFLRHLARPWECHRRRRAPAVAARVGPHGLGLDIDEAGRLVGTDGRAHDRLWVIGARRRGARWETTAVPEIRAKARRLVTDLRAGMRITAGLPTAA